MCAATVINKSIVDEKCKYLQIKNEKIKNLAWELYKKYTRNTSSTVGDMDVLAVIQLAGLTLKEKVDIKINQKFGSMTKAEKQYLKVFNKVCAICRMKPYPALDELIQTFGANRVRTRIRNLKKTYIDLKLSKLSEFDKQHLNLNDRAIDAAAVVLELRYAKLKADVLKIARASFITTEKLKEIMNEMIDLCGRLVGQRNKENGAKTAQEIDEEDDISYFMDGDLAPKEQRKKEFNDWCSRKLGKKRKIQSFKIVENDDESDSSSSEDLPIGGLVVKLKEKSKKRKAAVIPKMFENVKKRKINAPPSPQNPQQQEQPRNSTNPPEIQLRALAAKENEPSDDLVVKRSEVLVAVAKKKKHLPPEETPSLNRKDKQESETPESIRARVREAALKRMTLLGL